MYIGSVPLYSLHVFFNRENFKTNGCFVLTIKISVCFEDAFQWKQVLVTKTNILTSRRRFWVWNAVLCQQSSIGPWQDSGLKSRMDICIFRSVFLFSYLYRDNSTFLLSLTKFVWAWAETATGWSFEFLRLKMFESIYNIVTVRYPDPLPICHPGQGVCGGARLRSGAVKYDKGWCKLFNGISQEDELYVWKSGNQFFLFVSRCVTYIERRTSA